MNEVPLAFYSDPLILSAISSSTPSSPPNPLARKVAPAAAAIGVDRGEVGRDNSSRQGLPVPRRSLTVAEYLGSRRDLEGHKADSVANKEVYRRVDA